MTEKELRRLFVDTACSYIGYNVSDGSHKRIIDLYNTQKSLPRGYKVQYNDPWCASFVSAVSVKCGFMDIVPTECGCEEMIKLYKKIGAWEEDESITPNVGDIIFYDWEDNGIGNDTGYADHVGIVVNVENGMAQIVEGNISNAVGYRKIALNGRSIRGYGRPDYASLASDTDIGDVSDWAYDSCVKAVKKGIIHGDGDGNFRWHDSITREELCVMLDNAKFI